MKHLIICREYPPSPGGGIGTYVFHISRLLAESGETVHVISQLCEGSEKNLEKKFHGRLIVHRIPFAVWTSSGRKLSPAVESKEAKGLFESSFYPQCFSWQASLLAESLVAQEGIDIIEAQEYEAPLYYFQLDALWGLDRKDVHPVSFICILRPNLLPNTMIGVLVYLLCKRQSGSRITALRLPMRSCVLVDILHVKWNLIMD